MSNIYEKLQKLREQIGKESVNTFDELLECVNRKSKNLKVLPLYTYYDHVSTLELVNLEDIKDVIRFHVPTDMVASVESAKRHLYGMAFDRFIDELISVRQYLTLLERMKKLNVKESEILERYRLTSLEDMDVNTYKRCMTVLDRMDSGKNK